MLSKSLGVIAVLASLAPSGHTYSLIDSFEGANFFDNFNFFTAEDPTHGFVKYVDEATARTTGLIQTGRNGTRIAVDSEHVYNITGRPSVRLTSKKTYDKTLMIVDIAHMPAGVCGLWPAIWSFGEPWPVGGEINLVEGVNTETSNSMVLHTSEDCRITANNSQTGQSVYPNCNAFAPDQPPNVGCSVLARRENSFGKPFNSNGGGVFAVDWKADGIKMWFFPRGQIPRDIEMKRPDPSSWGLPVANYQGQCDFAQRFRNHNIIISATFCGDWAGTTWSKYGCGDAQSNLAWKTEPEQCALWVGQNPHAYRDAYWDINSIRVYQCPNSTVTSGGTQHPGANSTSNSTGPYRL